MPRSDPPLYPACPAAAIDAAALGVPLRTTSWTAWDALWAVLGSVVIANVVALVVLLLGQSLDSGWLLLTVAAPWIAMAGWPLLATARRGNGAQIDLGLQLRIPDALGGLAGGAAAFGAGILVGLISVWLFGDFTSAAGEEAEELAASNGFGVLLIFALMVVIGAPIAEELAFRGLLWSGLAKRGVPPWLTVVVSAAAFAAMHLEPKRFLLLFTIGVVLGIVRWRTGSLGACIIAHAVNNFPGALGILALSAA